MLFVYIKKKLLLAIGLCRVHDVFFEIMIIVQCIYTYSIKCVLCTLCKYYVITFRFYAAQLLLLQFRDTKIIQL